MGGYLFNMMKRITALASAIVLTMFLALSVSANTVFEKDFKDGVLEPFEPNPGVSQFELCEYQFTDAGLRFYNITENYKSYTIPFGKSGMEINSDKYYLVTFEGVVNSPDPDNYEMIIQFFAKNGDADNWININGKDGLVVSDAGAYPINADGTFKVEALVTPNDLSFDEQGNIEKFCVWGKYSNNPKDYTITYLSVEECDENGNVAGKEASTVATGETSAAAATDKGSADTGIEGIAVVAGIALAAAGTIVISRKRK